MYKRQVKNRRMVMELDKGWKTWLCDKSAYGLSLIHISVTLEVTEGEEGGEKT